MDVPWIAAQFPDLSGLAPLARGGQKIVFAAEHPVDGEVVLKLLPRETGERRLEREVLAGELIDCPRVPRIFATDTLNTPLGLCIWLREERVQGATLRQVLQSGPLGEAAILRLGSQLLEALAAAEQKRIVHRDIKPENVMVDPNGDYWLLDFGLSRHLDLESLTATQHAFGVGTCGYSAPEQMKNRKRAIDSRADLFALGVLLYEAATGANPFFDGARDQLDVLRRVEKTPLPRLRLPYDPEGELADLVATLTHKYPSQRPASVAEASAWLGEIVEARRALEPKGVI